MKDSEITQDLSTPVAYRYYVRHLGRRRSPRSWELGLPAFEYGAEVVDAWTGDVMTVHWAASAQLASLVAETKCAEGNAPAVALKFASKLGLFIDRALEEYEREGDILEDVGIILEWHLGILRGLKREPLEQAHLHVPAPEFNR